MHQLLFPPAWGQTLHQLFPVFQTFFRSAQSLQVSDMTARQEAPSCRCFQKADPGSFSGISGEAAVMTITSNGAFQEALHSHPCELPHSFQTPHAKVFPGPPCKLIDPFQRVNTSGQNRKYCALISRAVPISRTLSPFLISASSVIRATIYGWEIVWPCPMGRESLHRQAVSFPKEQMRPFLPVASHQ
jgi:hypothetical protein